MGGRSRSGGECAEWKRWGLLFRVGDGDTIHDPTWFPASPVQVEPMSASGGNCNRWVQGTIISSRCTHQHRPLEDRHNAMNMYKTGFLTIHCCEDSLH